MQSFLVNSGKACEVEECMVATHRKTLTHGRVGVHTLTLTHTKHTESGIEKRKKRLKTKEDSVLEVHLSRYYYN